MAEPHPSKIRSVKLGLFKMLERLSLNAVESTNTYTDLQCLPDAVRLDDRTYHAMTKDDDISLSQITDKDVQLSLTGQTSSFTPGHPCEANVPERRNTSADCNSARDQSSPRFVPISGPPSPRIISRDSPTPLHVACRLALVINKEDARYHKDFIMIKWQEGDDHKTCFDIISRYVTSLTPDSSNSYETSRQFRILKDVSKHDVLSSSHRFFAKATREAVASNLMLDVLLNRKSSEIQLYAEHVFEPQAWKETLSRQLLTQFSNNEHARIFIELRTTYKTFRTHACDTHESCRQSLKKDIELSREYTNSQSQLDSQMWFVPRSYLDSFYDMSLIEHFIDVECDAFKDLRWTASGQTSKRALVSGIWLFAVRLFALCIYTDLSMDKFFLMYKEGVRDTDLPLSQMEIDRWIGLHSEEGFIFWEKQKHFVAHQFAPRAIDTYEAIPNAMVLPFTLQSENVVQGANGTVYKVQIHEDHHAFLPDRSEVMALKQMRTIDLPAGELVSNLTLSATANRHLTPLLASWIYEDVSYILLPWAECSLADLFGDERTLDLRDTSIEWLLEQTAGLMAALDRIHNVGWHHDLKPSNILLFSDGMLKISDFGTAQIHPNTLWDSRSDQSLKEQYPPGDWDYNAPDYEICECISRPYDVFALGCVFVEMLCWLSGKGSKQLKDFRLRRLEHTSESPISMHFRSANFWYRGSAGCELKPVVGRSIKELKNLVESKPVLGCLITYIESMLTIHPAQRPTAAVLSGKLDLLHRRAVLEFKQSRRIFRVYHRFSSAWRQSLAPLQR